jgi:hypothetical protein
MKKKRQALTGLLMLITGFILNVLAWSILPGPVLSTIGLGGGQVLMFAGIIFLLLSRN